MTFPLKELFLLKALRNILKSYKNKSLISIGQKTGITLKQASEKEHMERYGEPKTKK